MYQIQPEEKAVVGEILERERLREDALKKLRIITEKRTAAERERRKTELTDRENKQIQYSYKRCTQKRQNSE